MQVNIQRSIKIKILTPKTQLQMIILNQTKIKGKGNNVMRRWRIIIKKSTKSKLKDVKIVDMLEKTSKRV
jgi:hypothetical protein